MRFLKVTAIPSSCNQSQRTQDIHYQVGKCWHQRAPAPCFASRPFQIRTRVPSGFAHRGAHWWRPIGTNYGPCYSRIIRCLGPRTFWPDCIAPQRPLKTRPYETPQVPFQGLASRCDHVDTLRPAWSVRLQHPWFRRADCPAHRRAARRTIKGRSPLKFG